MIKHICKYCHKEYYSKNRASKFCSKECYAKSYKTDDNNSYNYREKPGPKPGNIPWNKKERIEKICKCCGNKFSTIRTDAKFCSKECYDKWREENPKERTFGYHIVCKNCGKEFNTSNKDQQFCCVSCVREYQKKGYRYNDYIIKICPVCGKEFKVKQGLKNQIYCSRECRYKAQVVYEEGKRVEQRNTAKIRRARLKEPLPKMFLKALFVAQKGRCIYCGKPLDKDKTIDHIKPVCKGGSNERHNLLYCCKRCNSQKGTKDFVDYVMEYHKASIIDDSMIITHIATLIEKKWKQADIKTYQSI